MSEDGDIDVSGFIRITEGLANISGRDFEDVLLPSIGKLLENCIAHTHARQVPDITRRVSASAGYIEFADGTEISTWKKAGTMAGGSPEMYRDTSTYPQYADRWPKKSPQPRIDAWGMTWHRMNDPNRHWSDQRWAGYQAKLAQIPGILQRRLEETLRARGLAKQSWWQIAVALGLEIEASAYVRAAFHKKAPAREGFATQLVDRASLIVEMTNANSLVVGKLNGREILERGLAAREKAFDTEMSKGVFDDIAMRAKRYPGVFLEAA